MPDAIDEAKLEAFMGQVVGQMTGAVLCFGMWLGDELGLNRAMSDEGPMSADDLAERTGCHPRTRTPDSLSRIDCQAILGVRDC
jgi:hypothetical protein